MVLVQPQRVCPPCLLQTMFGLPMVTSHWGASPPGCTSEKPNRHLSGASPCHALAQPAFVPQLRLARAPGRLNLRKSTWPNQAPTWYNVRYEEDAKYLRRMGARMCPWALYVKSDGPCRQKLSETSVELSRASAALTG